MITKMMDIKIPSGLDPSTIALFIQIASQYDSSVYVEVDDKQVNAKSIMGMMTLGVPMGGKVNVIADGKDEAQVIEHISKYLNNEK
ncbi:MAG: HPr family phosphocarrier protein [Eubacterium sp.]|nr:HPr family phosphocarrier protein [Eubacterium sp.]MDD7208673.1 HPr family phosphocarrier protein [Lachnospiraceae bacterium]MDY5497115.1 HPr family phosphocarrier protein [Anaerobutyricum sp.]